MRRPAAPWPLGRLLAVAGAVLLGLLLLGLVLGLTLRSAL